MANMTLSSRLSRKSNKTPPRNIVKTVRSAPANSIGKPVIGARERLLSTARKLFYTEGPRAVGIDRVLSESGVAKMSLYRHFGSKDELIVACLKAHEKDYWQLWEHQLNPLESTAVEQLRNAMRFIAKRTADPSYQGCIFLNTAQTFPDKTHPAHQTSIEHKQDLATRLLKLCRSAKAKNPQALSRQLILLINGAQATAGMLGKETQHAIVEAADILLRAQEIKF